MGLRCRLLPVASWICHFGSFAPFAAAVPEFDKTFYKLIYVLNMLPAQRLSQLDFAGKSQKSENPAEEKFPPCGPHQSSIMSMGPRVTSWPLWAPFVFFSAVFINKAFVFPIMSIDRRLSGVPKWKNPSPGTRRPA